MTHDELLSALREAGVPESMLSDMPRMPEDVSGLLVYGSVARGDSVEGSDVDLLALTSTSRPSYHKGDVSLSYYTEAQLQTGVGTLFGAHLRRDSKIIWDDGVRLRNSLDRIGDVDPTRVFARSRAMSALFTNPHRDLPKYLPGLVREARYLLRSCMYAQAIADGSPCFSVRELAERHGDPDLARLLASRQSGGPSRADLENCLARLSSLVGDPPTSDYGSLEATVVNEWGRQSDLLSMAFMALGATGDGDYAEVEKILL